MRRACLAMLMLAAASAAHAQQPRSRVLQRWLWCIECVNGELDSVRSLARREPDSTIAQLSRILIRGVPASVQGAQRRYLNAVYSRDSAYSGSDSLARADWPRREFLNEYEQTMTVRLRSRAAIGLAAIGGPGPRMALDSALGMSLPEELEMRVRLARDSVWHP